MDRSGDGAYTMHTVGLSIDILFVSADSGLSAALEVGSAAPAGRGSAASASAHLAPA